MAVSFTTTLAQKDWDQGIGGWRCPALKIPSATVDAIYIDGVERNLKHIKVIDDLNIVKWLESGQPDQAVLSIRIAENLSFESLTRKWKKLAIILPVVATVFAAILGPILTQYFSNSSTIDLDRVTITQKITGSAFPLNIYAIVETERLLGEGIYMIEVPILKNFSSLYKLIFESDQDLYDQHVDLSLEEDGKIDLGERLLVPKGGKFVTQFRGEVEN